MKVEAIYEKASAKIFPGVAPYANLPINQHGADMVVETKATKNLLFNEGDFVFVPHASYKAKCEGKTYTVYFGRGFLRFTEAQFNLFFKTI